MNLLDENNFVENKNGRVSEAQLAGLKKRANIWSDVLVVGGILALVGFFFVLAQDLPWIIPALVGLGIFVFWVIVRSPTLIKYYVLALPDARENQIAYAAGKLAYHGGYILQTDDMRLSLFGDKNEGLLAGNLYEVHYLPRAKMVISARVLRPVSEAQQAREFTLLFGQLLGFTEADIQANRSGEFTSEQKSAIVKKGWWVILLVLFIIALALSQILPMLIHPAFLDDAIMFTICMGGLAISLIGVIFLAAPDAKNLLALFEGKLEQKEGVVSLSARTTGYGKSRTTRYYLGVGIDFELQVPQRTYEILVDGLYCRIYYTPRMKCLASLEVLKV